MNCLILQLYVPILTFGGSRFPLTVTASRPNRVVPPLFSKHLERQFKQSGVLGKGSYSLVPSSLRVLLALLPFDCCSHYESP